MTGIKPSTHGIVVDHKESNVRFAISDRNYNERIHRKVRDLRPGETVWGYQPKALPSSQGSADSQGATGTQDSQAKSLQDEKKELPDDHRPTKATQTEGSTPVASQEKEGK